MFEIKADQLFEKKGILERVRANFLALSERSDIGAAHVIDASGSPDEVYQDIVTVVQARFPELQGILQ